MFGTRLSASHAAAWRSRKRAPAGWVAVEATSRPRQFGYETPQLRLERRLHAGSPYRSNDLVSAGPEPPLSCDLRLNHARFSDFKKPVPERPQWLAVKPSSDPALRVQASSLYKLVRARVSRPRCSADRRSPGDAPTIGDWETRGRRGRAGRQETLPEPRNKSERKENMRQPQLCSMQGEARRAAFPPGSAHFICGSQQMYSKSRDDRRIYKLGSLPLPRAWGKFGQARATIDVKRNLAPESSMFRCEIGLPLAGTQRYI